MRVLHVINGLGAGGAERSLAELLGRYEATGIKSSVVCLRRRTEGVESSVLAGNTPVRFVSTTNAAQRVLALRRLLNEVNPNVIHTTLFQSDVLGRFAAIGTNIPVLTSLVNTSYDPMRLLDPNVTAWKLAAVREIDSFTARHLTTHFHALTEAVKLSSVATMRIDPRKVTVVERGRDAVRLGRPSQQRRAEARQRLEIDPDAEVLISVGRHEKQKDHETLLEAFKQMADRPKLRLLLAGRNGHTTPAIHRLAATPGVAGRVRILGHREDIPDLLAASDIFVFPSIYEGLGGALIEAMALGLPIVATAIPAIAEVVMAGVNADLVPVADPVALAHATKTLLDDNPRMASYGRQSLLRFNERFTLDRSVERMVAMYHQVAATGR